MFGVLEAVSGEPVNEATLEVRAADALCNALPGLKERSVTAQTSFSIQLGHVTHTKSAGANTAKGRSDLLVSVDGSPTAIVELKAPGVDLDDDDRAQGLSYARLHEPMVPLVVVSNGNETRVYRTIDGKHLFEIPELEALLADVITLGHDKLDAAVKGLLGRDADVWASVSQAVTDAALQHLTGPLADLLKPVVEHMSVKRSCIPDLMKRIRDARRTSRNEGVIVVRGPPLSGKTNVLVQLVWELRKAGDHPVLLLAEDVASDPFDYLADELASVAFRGLKGEDVRSWLRSTVSESPDLRLVMLVDGWTAWEHTNQGGQLYAFASACRRGGLPVVLALDDATWQLAARPPFRSGRSRLGDMCDDVALLPWAEPELAEAERLAALRGLGFHTGWRRSSLLTVPRIWRIELALAEARQESSESDTDDPPGMMRAVLAPPVPTHTTILGLRKRYLADVELRHAYRRLAETLIVQGPHGNDADSVLFHLATRAVPRALAERESADAFELLRRSDHVRASDGPGGVPVFVPTIPEIVGAACIELLADRLESTWADGNADAFRHEVDQLTWQVPSGEIITALAFTRLTPDAQSGAIKILLDEGPPTEELPSNKMLGTRFGQRNFLVAMGNASPEDGSLQRGVGIALVLSHLAMMTAVDPDTHEVLVPGPCHDIWWSIGNTPFPLLSLPPMGRVLTFRSHSLHGGAVLCSDDGILEPITWSMAQGIAVDALRDSVVELAEDAIQDGRMHLLHRLNHAAARMRSAVHPATATAATHIYDITWAAIKSAIETD